ncbi:MAG: hypothetical protein U0W40_07815 [Acidimicrobiia bacterium]
MVNTLNDRLDSVEAKSDRIKTENGALADQNDKLSGAIRPRSPSRSTGASSSRPSP